MALFALALIKSTSHKEPISDISQSNIYILLMKNS